MVLGPFLLLMAPATIGAWLANVFGLAGMSLALKRRRPEAAMLGTVALLLAVTGPAGIAMSDVPEAHVMPGFFLWVASFAVLAAGCAGPEWIAQPLPDEPGDEDAVAGDDEAPGADVRDDDDPGFWVLKARDEAAEDQRESDERSRWML